MPNSQNIEIENNTEINTTKIIASSIFINFSNLKQNAKKTQILEDNNPKKEVKSKETKVVKKKTITKKTEKKASTVKKKSVKKTIKKTTKSKEDK